MTSAPEINAIPTLALEPKSHLSILRMNAPRHIDSLMTDLNADIATLENSTELRELIHRLAGRRDDEVWSASAELFFAAYAARQGFTISLHPVQANNKRPEFRATKPQSSFLLEVRSLVPPTIDSVEGKFRAYLDQRAETILGDSPVHVEVAPQSAVSGSLSMRHLAAALQKAFERYTEGLGSEFDESVDGVPFKFSFVNFGGGGPSIGWFKGAGRIDEVERIRDAIEKKGHKYGSITEPFAIVIDSQDWFRVSPEQLNWALYGTHVVSFTVPKLGSTGEITASRASRTRDGVFREDKNTRISAVIFHRASWQDTTLRHSVAVYHNAFATHPFPEEVFKGYPQFVVRSDSANQGHYEWIDGKGDSF